MTLVRTWVGSFGYQFALVDELGNVVARRETNADLVFWLQGSVILFQAFSQGVRGNPNDGIDLRVKIHGSSQDLHGNAVFLDFVDGSFKVPITNKSQQPNKIVGSPKDTRAQKCFQLSSLRLKPFDR